MLHKPVLLQEILDIFNPIRNDGIFIDTTFGAGGHSRAILEGKRHSELHAFDRDEGAGIEAAKLAKQYDGRFFYHHSKFSEIFTIMSEKAERTGIYGILFDLGVSSCSHWVLIVEGAGLGKEIYIQQPKPSRPYVLP